MIEFFLNYKIINLKTHLQMTCETFESRKNNFIYSVFIKENLINNLKINIITNVFTNKNRNSHISEEMQ